MQGIRNYLSAFIATQLIAAWPVCAQGVKSGVHESPELLAEQLKLVKAELQAQPHSALLHFKTAEILRKLKRNQEALEQYERVTKLDPTNFPAYHFIATLSSSEKQLEAASAELEKLMQQKPNELMLRVALSEVLEKRHQYYDAARTLIQITYANQVPEKHRLKVEARIRYLLALSKDKTQNETAQVVSNTEEELDVVPPPLPIQPRQKSLASAKVKESREMKGVGHTPLLP